VNGLTAGHHSSGIGCIDQVLRGVLERLLLACDSSFHVDQIGVPMWIAATNMARPVIGMLDPKLLQRCIYTFALSTLQSCQETLTRCIDDASPSTRTINLADITKVAAFSLFFRRKLKVPTDDGI
jgi:hypothetical protein